jgi:hypothetical protein
MKNGFHVFLEDEKWAWKNEELHQKLFILPCRKSLRRKILQNTPIPYFYG